MSAAHNFHLRGRRFHAPASALQHGVQQVPTGVGAEFQQSLVNRGQRHLGMGCRLAVGQLDLNGDLRFTAHGVALFVGLHAHIQLVNLGINADFCHTKSESGFAQIYQCGWGDIFTSLIPKGCPPLARCFVAPSEKRVPRHLTQPPPQREHTHIHVRTPAVFDGQADGGVLTV